MPVIRISDATFSDLKTMSAWFETKTPSDTLDKVIAEMMNHLGLERDEEPHEPTGAGAMKLTTTPGLSFTRVLSATVMGKQLKKPNWANVLLAVIEVVKSKGFEGSDLVRELQVPSQVDRFEHF